MREARAVTTSKNTARAQKLYRTTYSIRALKCIIFGRKVYYFRKIILFKAC